MNHPIFFHAKSIYYALIAWGVIITAQTVVLLQFYQLSFIYAALDALIFNLYFAILTLGIWYPVRFINIKQSHVTDIILNHAGAAAISIIIWYLASYGTLHALFLNNKDYILFLNSSIPWRFIMGLFLYLITIFSFYLYISFRNMEEKIAKEAELKGLIRETELSLLKSQINPHFLFNSLNSISSLTITNPEKAQEMIIKLSDYLRYSIGHKEKQLVSLKEEINNVQLYLSIEEIRFGDRLNFSIELSPESEEKELPNMILQPLIENAIKHGVYESIEPITIWVDSKCINDNLVVTIKNNFDKGATHKKGTGMGLKNIQNRLKLIYQSDSLVQVSKQENTFQVTVIFPQKLIKQ